MLGPHDGDLGVVAGDAEAVGVSNSHGGGGVLRPEDQHGEHDHIDAVWAQDGGLGVGGVGDDDFEVAVRGDGFGDGLDITTVVGGWGQFG